ncbi:MAG: hypothetical protein QOF03_292 [Alphaproteobacteria bacterium]|nr:hypothetical protein [Alphaproteobacteria bacterium]
MNYGEWGRPGLRNLFRLDPSKPYWPQILSIIGQFAIIFGGPSIALVTIAHYPFLIQDRTLYIGGLSSIGFWFLASFVVANDFPRGTPQSVKLIFRAGYGLCMTGLLLGLSGIANGYGMPLISRTAAVVSKRPTLQRDPSARTYYVATRAWSGSQTVVELGAPREVYDNLNVPITAYETPQTMLDAMPDAGHVRLILGQGRFGLEWLKRIELTRPKESG